MSLPVTPPIYSLGNFAANHGESIMAARKKTSARKATKIRQFVVLYSECGNIEQLTVLGSRSFLSADAAMKGFQKLIDSSGECLDFTCGKAVIAEIVEVGSPSGFSWDKSNTISEN
jgi:hypothetical protein